MGNNGFLRLATKVEGKGMKDEKVIKHSKMFLKEKNKKFSFSIESKILLKSKKILSKKVICLIQLFF